MKHTLPKLLAGIALALALAPAAPRAQSADPSAEATRLRADVARMKREIQRAENDIRRTDSLFREEQAAAARSRERLTRDRERREKENAALADRVTDVRARIAAERGRGDAYDAEVAEIKAREKAVLAFLAGAADSLASRIAVSIPWETETRRERVLALKRDIEAGSAAPEEALARLAALLREETRGGDEVTLSERPLTRRNGEVVNAQVLRLGNQALFYMDDEGKKFGVLEPAADGKSGWTWREDVSFSERNAIKRAIAVKAGREAPQLAPLTVPLAGLEGGR